MASGLIQVKAGCGGGREDPARNDANAPYLPPPLHLRGPNRYLPDFGGSETVINLTSKPAYQARLSSTQIRTADQDIIAEENCMTEDRHKEVSDGHPENAISAYGTARSTVQGAPLSSEELREIDEYWRASLYLCLGMLYLQDNPLLREPLKIEHVKPRMLGHWGSDAGQTFTYIHFNRLIKKYDLNAIYLSGPGHGVPSVLSQGYLEGTYSEIYPDKSEDLAGLQRFFRQFSFPGGIGSHATPETPGSINEGGELGYCISHAYGTVDDHPNLIALTVVGDGEAETSTATRSTTPRSWPASATRSWRRCLSVTEHPVFCRRQ